MAVKKDGSARRERVSTKFGAVDTLFGESIEVRRSLYFTMSAKTFYTQSGNTTINTNQVGHVRLDLDSGEALATLDFGDGVSVSGDVMNQAKAQLEIFRQAVERLFNKKRGAGIVEGGGGRKRRRSDAGVPRPQTRGPRKPKGEESVPMGDIEQIFDPGPEDSKEARLKAKRERDAALKREKRAAAIEAKRAGGANGQGDQGSEYEEVTPEQWAEYEQPQGTEA